MRRFGIIILVLLALPLALRAQDEPRRTIPIKEVTVYGRRPMKEIGVQQTKFDSVVLKENIALSIADVLTFNSSIFVKSYGRATLSTVSFRGTSPSHTQVSWNGIRINNPMLGMTDFSMIPSYFIEDASLLHGTSSVNETGGGHPTKHAYNLWNDTFSDYDGEPGYANASKEAIAYYMDPRNFLNDQSIFMFEALSYQPTFQTDILISKILDNSFMPTIYSNYFENSYTTAFIDGANTYKISPIHLASRILQENGVNGSVSSRGYFTYNGIICNSKVYEIVLVTNITCNLEVFK